jgi:hypothetical protein
MHLSEERMQGQLPVSLAGIGTGGARWYLLPVLCIKSTASSNTSISRRRCEDLPQNRETPPVIKSREGTVENTSSGMLRGSSEDKTSSPSLSTVASPIHSPPTIFVNLIIIVDLCLNSFHSFHPLHKIMMMLLIASMCE